MGWLRMRRSTQHWSASRARCADALGAQSSPATPSSSSITMHHTHLNTLIGVCFLWSAALSGCAASGASEGPSDTSSAAEVPQRGEPEGERPSTEAACQNLDACPIGAFACAEGDASSPRPPPVRRAALERAAPSPQPPTGWSTRGDVPFMVGGRLSLCPGLYGDPVRASWRHLPPDPPHRSTGGPQGLYSPLHRHLRVLGRSLGV